MSRGDDPLPAWPRAHGVTLFGARIRAEPSDFEVTEDLGWEPEDDGEHAFLWVEKTGANTDWVARQLAAFAQVPVKDVGYAGLKDRHAVTRQWFSVPRWHAPDWSALSLEGVRVLEVRTHRRKLRRGAHQGNQFRIVLRLDEQPDDTAVEARLASIRARGVPNYYGEQRFGRRGANLRLADTFASGKRLSRTQRSLAISTIRSFVFNEALGERVANGTWDALDAGDLANLDGTGSVFEVAQVTDDLVRRCAEMDLHPAIALVGGDSPFEPAEWKAALHRARVEAGSRSLRLRVHDLYSSHCDDHLTLSFTLDRGAFATSVLRELCDTRASQAPAAVPPLLGEEPTSGEAPG